MPTSIVDAGVPPRSGRPDPAEAHDHGDGAAPRLPTALRERLQVEAAAEGRSVEAEIVARLQRSFEAPRVLSVEHQHGALTGALLNALTQAYLRSGESREAIARRLAAVFLDYLFEIDELLAPERSADEGVSAPEQTRRRRTALARMAAETGTDRARRQVAEGAARVSQQRARIAELARDGHGTAGSEALLATMEETLAVMRDHLEQEEALERLADPHRRGNTGACGAGSADGGTT